MVDQSLDFTPFDAEENLLAVNDILRAVRHMSWSYAGDISRVVKKICQTFDAGRCILFAAREGNSFDVYEYAEGEIEKSYRFFDSETGQLWLNRLAESGSDFLSSDKFVEMGTINGVEVGPGSGSGFGEAGNSGKPADYLPGALLDPPSHILPLKNPYTSRYGIKPGFMLVQESRGLTRWNSKQLDSLVIIAEYLAMTIECERLTSAMQIETSLGERVPGLLSRRRFSDLVQWEIAKLEKEPGDDRKASFLLIGFPERTRLGLPQLIRDSGEVLDLCGRAIVDSLAPSELAAYWRGDILVAFSSGSREEFFARVKAAARGAIKKWFEADGTKSLGADESILDGIPAFGLVSYPGDGKNLEDLYQAALKLSKID